ncbi:hypothetical protein CLCR_07803 [Cladophialophora carrionii]|uniref:Uncharacterized protein n=1 Tax=Cladophialophora carrionii TaxID=86049 RepID=A0A1C1CN60_9EURO|nr:hypothetical protein CLCR_07803 [Cladophialophora carrionii]
MASIIVGSALLIGHAIHERKEKKREKARLTEEQFSDAHGKPALVSSRRLRKQQQVEMPELPSYESVVSERPGFSTVRDGDEKPRRRSEDNSKIV